MLKNSVMKKEEDIDNGWTILRLKMKNLIDKVKVLEEGITKLTEKYGRPEPKINGSDQSNMTLVCKDKMQVSAHNPDLNIKYSRPQPETKGSDITNMTLVYSDEEQASAHQVIILSQNFNFNMEEKDGYNPDKSDVSLVHDDEKKIFAHSIILSTKKYEVTNENKEIKPEKYSNRILSCENTTCKLLFSINSNQCSPGVQPSSVFQSWQGCKCSVEDVLHQFPVASTPSTCPPSPTLHIGQCSRGQLQGESYYERGSH